MLTYRVTLKFLHSHISSVNNYLLSIGYIIFRAIMRWVKRCFMQTGALNLDRNVQLQRGKVDVDRDRYQGMLQHQICSK